MRLGLLGALAALAMGAALPLAAARADRGSTGPSLERIIRGKVAAVDPQDRTITLEDQRDPVKVSVRAYVLRNGEPAQLDDIQPGDEVRAAYLSGEPVHAQRVEAIEPGAGQGSAGSGNSGY